VLGRAAALGRLRDLVDALIDRFQATALRDFIAQLPEIDLAQDVPAAVPDSNPFGGRLLPQRRAFLDRNPVRMALTDLSSPDGARVLIVDGPSGSGRSHVWFLVSHGCDRLGLPPNAAVRIQPSSSSVDAKAWEPLDLMNDIAERLEWPKPVFDPHAQADSYLRPLASWFRTNATKFVTTPRWLVIDDVSSVYMTEPGQRMAAEIANSAATDQAGELRVLLLGYGGVLSADADQTVSRENIVYLDADALKTYFKELAASVGEDLQKEAINMLVEKAAGDPPYSVPLPFGRIGAGIGQVANDYLQTAGT
jgi:hypothetical protein